MYEPSAERDEALTRSARTRPSSSRAFERWGRDFGVVVVFEVGGRGEGREEEEGWEDDGVDPPAPMALREDAGGIGSGSGYECTRGGGGGWALDVCGVA